MPDPVRKLEHTHGHLTKLVAALSSALTSAPWQISHESRTDVSALASLLRDELLAHFADEEEALFPFLRARTTLPSQSDAIDRLEAAHESLCQLLSTLVRVATEERDVPALAELHARFSSAYADHSVDELTLFEQLDRLLDEADRAELARKLRGLKTT